MKNILISGINGFVGSNVKDYLSKYDYGIYGLSRKVKENASDQLTHFSWGNLSLLYNSNLNTIIHLAGIAHETNRKSSDEEYFIVNTDFTKTLYDVFLQSNAETFIFLSSVKAVADQVEGYLKEEAVPYPRTSYGRSKLKAEEYILSKEISSYKRVIILRPCIIYGPGNKGNLNLLYKFVRNRIPFPLTLSDNKRSFLSVENLGYVLKQIIEDSSISSGIYHLADDEPISTRDVVKIISKCLNLKPRFLSIPKAIMKGIILAGDVIGLPLNTDSLKKLTESYLVSNEKIKKAMRIECFPISVQEGLKRTFDHFNLSEQKS